MRYIYSAIVLLAIVLLTGCLSNEMPEQPQQAPIQYFAGQWALADTTSTYKSTHKPEGPAAMIIDTAAIKGDSLQVNGSRDNHEESSFMLYFDEPRGTTAYATNIPDHDDSLGCYALGYKTANAATTLVLYHINRKHKMTDSTSYVKAK